MSDHPFDPTAVHDARVDHISVFDPASGLVSQRGIAITPAEEHERDLRDMRAALASVDHRIAALDPNDVMPWEEPRSEATMAKLRAGLDAEREHVLSEIARLEAPPVEPQGQRSRK